MIKLSKLTAALLLILTSVVSTAFCESKAVMVELNKIAASISHDIQQNQGDRKPTLAVFPFQAEERLASRGTGVAVSQLLSHYIFVNRGVILVERSELSKVLEEQKLGLTGVIENDMALKVGHLLGSQFLLVGNISQIGKNYQINVRLVNAEDGKIINTCFGELEKSELDGEMLAFTPLVPQKEIITIAAVYQTPELVFSNKDANVMVNNEAIAMSATTESMSPYTGIAIRYSPLKNTHIELTTFPQTAKYTINIKATNYTRYANPWGDEDNSNIEVGPAYMLSITRAFPIIPTLNFVCGGGVLTSTIKFELHRLVGAIKSQYPVKLNKSPYEIYFVTAGFEYKVKQRLSLGVAGNLMAQKSSTMIAEYHSNDIEIGSVKTVPYSARLFVSLSF